MCIAQDGLINLGYDTGGLDGVFGNKTYEAVRSFQSRNGLSSDGIIGQNTWRVLMTQVVGMGRTSTTVD